MNRHEEVEKLLINHSDKKVNVQYASNAKPFELPEIGARPPYYCHPNYEAYYPLI
ncbi:hypothetical protein NSQ95_01370 [Psychrobacillus sp. FSL W7-1457]|uniref:hypothetical protein n=1 Tax=unclassified Psychrobacillus TaxID=2636677 RepID=UPI0030F690D8